MANSNFADDLVKEYLLFRGLTTSLKSLDAELKSEKDKGFRKEPHYYNKELAKMCMLASCTLILSWSPEEAGRYLETYKAFENKPPDMIMERTENTYIAQLTDCLTTVKKVNKTDVRTLLSTFGSLEKIVKADKDSLSLCPGLGPQKAKRLVEMFHEPFLKSKKRKTS